MYFNISGFVETMLKTIGSISQSALTLTECTVFCSYDKDSAFAADEKLNFKTYYSQINTADFVVSKCV
jgi:hypothetical protein